VKIIHFLSDSFATQYKNKFIFYLLAHALQESINVTEATWNYFEVGHGKGAPDGVGTTVKRSVDTEVSQGKNCDNFETFVHFAKKNSRNWKL